MVRIVFTLVLFSIILFLDFYIWNAFKSDINSAFVKWLYWIVSILSLFSILYPAINTNMTLYPGYMVVLFGLVFSVFAAKIIAIMPLFIDDIIRVFKFVSRYFSDSGASLSGEKINRLDFFKRSAMVLGAFTLTTLTYGILVGRFDFKKHFVNLKLKNFKSKNPLKIVQLSDMHLGSFQRVDKLEEAVELINDEKPDLIFFTGDLVNNHADEAYPFIDTLSKLKAKYGKFSVLGNHDYADYIGLDLSTEEGRNAWQKNHNEIIDIHQKFGFDLLLNENKQIELGDQLINIVGVENWGDGRFSKYGDIKKAMNGVVDGVPTFLLSHDPTHWQNKVLKHDQKVDLQLSGHTHGMQFGIEIGGIRWSPSQWKYKYWAGLYNTGDNFLYVNRGIGHLGYPGRVGILPEITVVNIS
ncbi:MAG: metallophosphoesterase [Flavobacteriales bacterium]|tara:strand:+ start:8131 stop:9363 length:1233 start_codon:yes stop_codon:yes gene_type:complete